jgi:1-deoxy-D-xylulose-5-phosphate reductoisomerase
MSRKRILLLGSTGSIGTQTLDVIDRHPDLYQVVGLAAGSNVDSVAEQATSWQVKHVGLADAGRAAQLGDRLGSGAVFAGPDGMVELMDAVEPDLVVAAISGFAGLPSILAALERGINVALANKEPLVAAGELVMATAKRSRAEVIPIDSELSAILQCVVGEDRRAIRRVLLTASGGPFAKLPLEQLRSVTPEQALAHPNWKMGTKVTVDSATLANKGFEVFEVRWLFGVSFEQIQVVVHHQSIVHSLVEFCDTSVIAQLGWPDMRVPIQYALSYPERLHSPLRPLDLTESSPLTFAEPDLNRFPCLGLAVQAGKTGRGYPVILTGADEAAVRLFLGRRISFTDIPQYIERALDAFEGRDVTNLQDIRELNDWADRFVTGLAGTD